MEAGIDHMIESEYRNCKNDGDQSNDQTGGKDLIGYFYERLDLPRKDIRSYSPLALAYIGDSVYDLLIRTEIVASGNGPVRNYHKQASSIVKADAQAAMIHVLLDELTDEEHEIFMRGRNANSYTKAKNATTGTYHRATGFEALLGYLYLTGQYERITDLIILGRKKLSETDTGGTQ